MYTKFQKINSNNGFTLIEIIASIALLGSIVVVLLPIFPQIMSWTQNTDDELVASNLLSQVASDIEEMELNQSLPTCPNMQAVEQDRYVEYSTYIVNNKKYNVELLSCLEEKVNLYRTNIRISSEARLISESYTYISGEAE